MKLLLSVMLLLLLDLIVAEDFPGNVTRVTTSTERYAPGNSIRLPGNGVGSYREISLSRGSPARYSDRDGRSVGAGLSASSCISQRTTHFYYCAAICIFSIQARWHTILHHIV